MDGSKGSPRFVDILVEGAGDCEEACLRFKAIEETRTVSRVRWTPERSEGARFGPAWFRVFARAEDGTRKPAQATLVEDSSAGVAMLVSGGLHGVWLVRVGDGGTAAGGLERGYAEPYLLLAREAVEVVF